MGHCSGKSRGFCVTSLAVGPDTTSPARDGLCSSEGLGAQSCQQAGSGLQHKGGGFYEDGAQETKIG